MQTINLTDKDGKAKGLGGQFRPTQIMICSISDELIFSVACSRPGKTAPIQITLKRENWKRVLVALGEELGK